MTGYFHFVLKGLQNLNNEGEMVYEEITDRMLVIRTQCLP